MLRQLFQQAKLPESGTRPLSSMSQCCHCTLRQLPRLIQICLIY